MNTAGGRLHCHGAAGGPDAEASHFARAQKLCVLVDPGLWALHLLALQRALAGSTFGLATEVTRDLRIVKDPEEIDRLRAAAHAADRVIDQVVHGSLVGRTEADVSREIGERLVAEGHQVAAFAIVASGELPA